jgi:vacuolar protein sorting-associated protein VTA1
VPSPGPANVKPDLEYELQQPEASTSSEDVSRQLLGHENTIDLPSAPLDPYQHDAGFNLPSVPPAFDNDQTMDMDSKPSLLPPPPSDFPSNLPSPSMPPLQPRAVPPVLPPDHTSTPPTPLKGPARASAIPPKAPPSQLGRETPDPLVIPSPALDTSAAQEWAPAPTVVDPIKIGNAQKHAKWAISALNYEDIDTAKKELRAALALIGG